MKNLSLIKLSAAVALGAFLTVGASAQNREKFGISAKAGGVNSVVGHALITRAGQKVQTDLTSQDDLESGDLVSTESGARVEVLLNPGTYLRVRENSEFKMVDNSLNHLLVKLIKGSAIIEATGTDNMDFHIGLATPQSRFTIVRRGVYRFNVTSGSTDLLVQKGRILVEGQSQILKGGNRITITGSGSTTAKLSKKELDEFDAWSKDRAQLLAKANQKLSVRTLNGYLSSYSYSNPLDWAFSSRSQHGFWTFSNTAGCYTFFPSTYGWSSPYGGGYGRVGWLMYDPFNRYGGPMFMNYPPYYGQNGYNGINGQTGGVIGGNGTTGGTSGGTTGGSTGSTGSTGGTINTQPSTPSQAGPRDPDSGGRSINRIKDPN